LLHQQALFEGKAAPFMVDNDTNWTYVYNVSQGSISSLGAQPPYPVCSLRWGHAMHHISTIDLAILSAYSYTEEYRSYQPGGEVYKATQQTFSVGNVSASIVHHQQYYKVGRVIATRFVERNKSVGTTVLAIKGSSQPFDFYMDATLWIMIAVIQAASLFVPLLDQLPNQVFALVLYMFPRVREQELWTNIDNVHNSLREEHPNDEFVITGHSLGGGIAIVAGGRLSVPALAFSGPGSHFSRWRFGTTMERTNRNSVNIHPHEDAVPNFDWHDELVQFIECRNASIVKEKGTDLPYRAAQACHSIWTTLCELWRACGDEKQRNFRHACGDLVHPDNRGRYITGNSDRRCWTRWT